VAEQVHVGPPHRALVDVAHAATLPEQGQTTRQRP
jgi:hypothetical protein